MPSLSMIELVVVPTLLAVGLVVWLTARIDRRRSPASGSEIHVRMQKLAAADRLKRLENPA
jgi:hypothetical protein